VALKSGISVIKLLSGIRTTGLESSTGEDSANMLSSGDLGDSRSTAEAVEITYSTNFNVNTSGV